MTLPPDLTFADLALELDDAGGLHYDWRAMERLCIANGIEPATALSSDDVACSLIADWYVRHREEGGEQDPVVKRVLERLGQTRGDSAAETIVALLNGEGRKGEGRLWLCAHTGARKHEVTRLCRRCSLPVDRMLHGQRKGMGRSSWMSSVYR